MSAPARLPELVVIGAMKCGTSALHAHLDAHPDIAMARGKELNFFYGPAEPPPVPEHEWWRHGQRHRGLAWYLAQFDPDARVRGESSPGYTDPSHPEVAGRMHATLPDARLVYLVREPLARALSQWRHHVADGDETRPAGAALLDEGSQYVARSRFYERLAPFLRCFGPERVLVVVQERLRSDPRGTLARVLEHVGLEPSWDPAFAARVHVGADVAADLTPRERLAFHELVADDLAALREELGDDLPEWR